jgi:predicted transcriptional regulator
MSEENYLSLQPSESTIASMASRIFAAYVQKGEVGEGNIDHYVKKSTDIALKIASYTDSVCKSDGEWMVEKSAGPASLL